MTSSLLSKRSNVAGHVPTTSQLSLGELSINTNDGLIYYVQQNSTTFANTIVTIGKVPPTANGFTNNTTISLSNSVTGSTNFNGTSGVTIPTTLANTGVTAGTYNTLTVNSQGLVTNASTVVYTTAGTYLPLSGGTMAGGLTITAVGSVSQTAITSAIFNQPVTISGAGTNVYYNNVNITANTSTTYSATLGLSSSNTAANYLNFNTYFSNGNTAQRWLIATDGTQTGSNTGSNFELYSYNDNSSITTAININRANSLVTIPNLSTPSPTISNLTLTNPLVIKFQGDFTGTANITGNIFSLNASLNQTFTAGTYSNIIVDSKGRVTGGSTPQRQLLAGNLTLYVATTGSDVTGNGSSGSPFASMQQAWNTIMNNYNFNGYTATVNVANGTYTSGVLAVGLPVGIGGSVSFVGNTTTPTNCVVSTSTTNCFEARNGANINVAGFNTTSTSSLGVISGCVFANAATISVNGNMDFGATSGAHICSNNLGTVYLSSSYTISGNAVCHWLSQESGSMIVTTASGVWNIKAGVTVNISSNFAQCNFGGCIYTSGWTVSYGAGASINMSGGGHNWFISVNGIINTNGGGNTYFPGTAQTYAGSGDGTNGNWYV